jgi:putative transposase
MCQMLHVSRSGYYDWRDRPPSVTQRRQEELMMQIRRVYDQARGVYGAPRITAELRAHQVSCARKTVARRMREAGLRAITAKAFRIATTDATHGYRVADNLVQQEFQASGPNRLWLGDITYLDTAEGWLYLAGIKDVFTRKIVGWSMADHLRVDLVRDALTMALGREQPAAGLIHHSDRGVQYAGADFQSLLTQHGITCSMSRAGNCYDNAPMESFWSSLKQELIYQRKFKTRAEARQAVFEYIEVFYNRQRLHSALEYRSPEAFHRQWLANQAA